MGKDKVPVINGEAPAAYFADCVEYRFQKTLDTDVSDITPPTDPEAGDYNPQHAHVGEAPSYRDNGSGETR